ncbi:MAG: 3-deoxy-7-phosphoheptulonate synthase [Elusimicrobia bacterium]|nr:3-deoxy-7-phosphoheptulonate synthase [Elusimicrobiota bacterium]
MILTLINDVTDKQIEKIEEIARDSGFIPEVSRGESRTIVLIKGENAILSRGKFDPLKAVERISSISVPFKLVSKNWIEKTIVKVGDIEVGGKEIVYMAGPCSVENNGSTEETASLIKSIGGTGIFRGGAFKPRTSPYSFQGMGEEGLKILKDISVKTGMKIVTEAMDPRQVELVEKYADIIQIGARSMQNFELLKECGKAKIPVLLKRGFTNTIKEFLMSAEYIASEGNKNIILCERGIRTFSDYVRFTLDISAVPVLKTLTHLPVIVDPSHPAGRRDYVESLSLAAIAAGADGLIVEVHVDPEKASSDGAETITTEAYAKLIKKADAVALAIGRGA